jgi:hypothetical protein
MRQLLLAPRFGLRQLAAALLVDVGWRQLAGALILPCKQWDAGPCTARQRVCTLQKFWSGAVDRLGRVHIPKG